jgi:catechol 2,3-dioxygenase
MDFHQSPVTYMSHVHLKVAHLPRSLHYYSQVIGFRVMEQSTRHAILTADGITPLLTIEQPDDVTPKTNRTTGLYHFALLLPSREDLGSFLQHAVQSNIRLGSSDHLVSEALYLDDPDHNGIEIYADRGPEDWNWIAGQLQMAVDPLNHDELLTLAKGKAWQGLPSTTKMGHIHLHVAHIPDTERFYTVGLDLQIMVRYGSQAIFASSGGYHHHFGLNTWQGIGAPAPAPTSVGLKYVSLKLANEEVRQRIIEQLKKIDVDVQYIGHDVVVHDPSHNEIHLCV